ncbi:putative MFS transporter [Exophiala viscosa]|uniref:putative MFS transporter n=1 Tax=Exophiala viscosa TaxID=2486360 RepID=UPI002198A450|nr:putative MFS transporter [Exophiala viscosa]
MAANTVTIHHTDVPGTVYLVDVDHSETGAAHGGRHDDIMLVPQPLSTARDPLNWSRSKKLWSLLLASFFACVMSFGENNLGAAWTQISDETNVSLNNMNGGSALNYLLLGFVNIIWVPTAMKIGRKFVFISSMTINMAAALWNAYIFGTVQWYLNNAFGGIGTSAYEAIIQLTVFDMFFAHQRGTMLAFYVWGMQLGSILGLILGGYIAAGPGWRWGCKIVAILSAFVVVLFIFTFDDTLFPRHIYRGRSGPAENAEAVAATAETHQEKTADGSEPQPKSAPPVTRQVTKTEGTMYKPPRTYWEILSPIHSFPEDKTTWWQYFRRPFVLFFFPNIVCAGIIFAFGCTAGIVSFNTISEILTDDPYDWGTGPTGLIFLAALVGSFIGMGTGYFGDQIVLRLARRNNGYKEPEMRLWALCFSFVYGGVGYFAYGWCSKEGESWVGIAFGLGAMIAQQVSATSIATTYAMECFEGISGELVVVLAICSSCINFAMSFSVQPLIDATDYGRAFTFFGCLVLGSMALAVPLNIWGKSWRSRCAERYHRFVAEAVSV